MGATSHCLRSPAGKREKPLRPGCSKLQVPGDSEQPCPCLQPVRGHYHFRLLQAREKLPPLELSFPSDELLFETTPPSFLLSSIKTLLSPLFFRPARGSPQFACPELQFLCYSQVNSLLPAELLIFFFFQNVDNLNYLNSVLQGKI